MVHAGCVFVAGIHPSRTGTSRSFESMRLNACVHRLDLGLYSHPKEFGGSGVRTHVNSKGKPPSTRKILPRGGWNPRRCIKQDSEPNTLPTSYSGPLKVEFDLGSAAHRGENDLPQSHGAGATCSRLTAESIRWGWGERGGGRGRGDE